MWEEAAAHRADSRRKQRRLISTRGLFNPAGLLGRRRGALALLLSRDGGVFAVLFFFGDISDKSGALTEPLITLILLARCLPRISVA